MNIIYLLIINPLVIFMKFILDLSYNLTDSYGLSIVLLSLVVNTVLLPLYYLAEKWQNAERNVQAKMLPELTTVKKEYSGEERYIKTTEVYKKHKYHPIFSLRTTFGFLIQVPFFIAAYTLLSKYKGFDGVSFLFVENLALTDGLISIGTLSINVLPILMTLFNLISSFVYTKGLTAGEKYKLLFIAFLFLFLLYSSPAALVMYWTLNNIYSLAKNFIHNPVKKDLDKPEDLESVAI